MIIRQNATKSLAREAEQTVIRAAFTLMEMLVVVAIIVALAGMGGYYFLGQLENSKKKTAQVQVRTTLKTAVSSYQIDHSQFPQSLQQLLQKDNYGGPYLTTNDAIIDPWGNPYQYNASATNPETGVQEPEISTTAPDGTRISNLGALKAPR